MNPHRANSRISIVGNYEDRYWQKNNRPPPIISYYNLLQITIMVVRHRLCLCQRDCKNFFYNDTLPENKTTTNKNPIGRPLRKPN